MYKVRKRACHAHAPYTVPSRAIVLDFNPSPLLLLLLLLADLFEAYVGGLFVEKGMEKVQEWLFEVLQPYAVEAYETIRKEYAVTGGIQPTDAIEEAGGAGGAETGYLPYLNQICAQRNWAIEWKFLPAETTSNAMPQWAVECYVDKQLRGAAKAGKKQKAKHEAARQALVALGIPLVSSLHFFLSDNQA